MPKVSLKHPKESFESLMRRFRKAVDNADTMKEVRKREFYEKPSETRKRAKASAKKREARRRREARLERSKY